MAAGKYHTTIEQGATWQRTLKFYTDSTQTTPVDFTDFIWRMHIREVKDSDTALIELDSDGNGIDVSNQDTGIIVITITAAQTEGLDFTKGYYDLECVSGSVVVRQLEGRITLNKEVTK